jgi:hypothetical protein
MLNHAIRIKHVNYIKACNSCKIILLLSNHLINADIHVLHVSIHVIHTIIQAYWPSNALENTF